MAAGNRRACRRARVHRCPLRSAVATLGRGCRGRDRACPARPRGSRRSGHVAARCRDPPVDPHARRRMLGRWPALAGARAARRSRRAAGGRGQALLHDGSGCDRRRRREWPVARGERTRRAGGCPRDAADPLRTHPRDQGWRCARRDRARRLQPRAQRAASHDRSAAAASPRNDRAGGDRRCARANRHPHRTRTTGGRGHTHSCRNVSASRRLNRTRRRERDTD